MKKFFKSLLTAVQEGQLRRAQYWQLNSMSNEALRDIGITRGEIKKVFDKHG